MQIICTSLQAYKHASTSSLNFYRPNHQCQNTEGNRVSSTILQTKHTNIKNRNTQIEFVCLSVSLSASRTTLKVMGGFSENLGIGRSWDIVKLIKF